MMRRLLYEARRGRVVDAVLRVCLCSGHLYRPHSGPPDRHETLIGHLLRELFISGIVLNSAPHLAPVPRATVPTEHIRTSWSTVRSSRPATIPNCRQQFSPRCAVQGNAV